MTQEISALPAPMTSPDCDLRGLEYMPLLGAHLFGSEFNARASDAEWRAALTLWWVAWTQQPAASLPVDDNALCRFADLGRDLKAWRKIKDMALYGFVRCADGRLYHPVLARQAMIAWDKRVKERERKAQWREKKKGQDTDVPRDTTGTEAGQVQGQDGQVPADVTRRDVTGRDSIIPLAKANGRERAVEPADDPIPDPAAVMFASGVRLLRNAGKTERDARAMLGKWRKDHGAEAVIEALGAAQREAAIDPVAFIEGRWRHSRKPEEGFCIGGVRMSSPC